MVESMSTHNNTRSTHNKESDEWKAFLNEHSELQEVEKSSPAQRFEKAARQHERIVSHSSQSHHWHMRGRKKDHHNDQQEFLEPDGSIDHAEINPSHSGPRDFRSSFLDTDRVLEKEDGPYVPPDVDDPQTKKRTTAVYAALIIIGLVLLIACAFVPPAAGVLGTLGVLGLIVGGVGLFLQSKDYPRRN
jgi:hypothetical protein